MSTFRFALCSTAAGYVTARTIRQQYADAGDTIEGVVVVTLRVLALVALLVTGCGRVNFESLQAPGVVSEAGTRDGQQSDAVAPRTDGSVSQPDAQVVDGRVLDATLSDASTDANVADASSPRDGGAIDAGAGCMGVSGTPIFCDSFEYSSIFGTPWSVGFAGNFTDIGYAGSQGARAQIQVAGETSSISLRDATQLAAMNNGLFFLRVHIRTANTFDQFDGVRLLTIQQGAGDIFAVAIDNDTVEYSAGTSTMNTGRPFSRSGWVCVLAEIQLGAGGYTRAWLDGQPTTTINHNLSGPPTRLALGILSSGANASDLDVHIDELVIDDEPVPCLP